VVARSIAAVVARRIAAVVARRIAAVVARSIYFGIINILITVIITSFQLMRHACCWLLECLPLLLRRRSGCPTNINRWAWHLSDTLRVENLDRSLIGCMGVGGVSIIGPPWVSSNLSRVRVLARIGAICSNWCTRNSNYWCTRSSNLSRVSSNWCTRISVMYQCS
jgi:hypothetical protein